MQVRRNRTSVTGAGHAALALVLVFVGAFASAQNLLINPGFETGTTNGWVKSAQGVFGVYPYPAPIHGGTYQSYVQSSYNESTHYAYILQDVAAVSNHVYTASVWGRNYAAYQAIMECGLSFYTAGGTWLANKITQTVNTNYTQLAASLIAPPGTGKVRVHLLVYSSAAQTGVANFDDASLVMSNAVPAANADNLSATKGTINLSISFASLLANDTDPEGDSLAVVAADGTSSNGVSLSIQPTSISYGGTLTKDDSFRYVVSDTFGGMATGLVSITAMPVPGTVIRLARGGTAASNCGLEGEPEMIQRMFCMSPQGKE